jgi:hypothetical protein
MGRDDPSMQCFQAPRFLKLDRQPIQQQGMRGGCSQRAKIIFRFDQSATKIRLPNTIDDDARGERILLADDPTSKVQPICIVGWSVERMQDGRRSGFHFLVRSSEVAFDEHG